MAISGNHLPDGEAHLKQLRLIDFATAVRIIPVGRGRRGEHLHACKGGGLWPAAVRSIPARSNQMAISSREQWQSVVAIRSRVCTSLPSEGFIGDRARLAHNLLLIEDGRMDDL